MSSKNFHGQEVLPEILQKARERYQEHHGKAPPVNEAEAENGVVRVGENYDRNARSWREYDGVKSVNPEEISYKDLEADSPHVHDPEADWQEEYEVEATYDNEQIGEAVDVFERITGDENSPLEPKSSSFGEENQSQNTKDRSGW